MLCQLMNIRTPGSHQVFPLLLDTALSTGDLIGCPPEDKSCMAPASRVCDLCILGSSCQHYLYLEVQCNAAAPNSLHHSPSTAPCLQEGPADCTGAGCLPDTSSRYLHPGPQTQCHPAEPASRAHQWHCHWEAPCRPCRLNGRAAGCRQPGN